MMGCIHGECCPACYDEAGRGGPRPGSVTLPDLDRDILVAALSLMLEQKVGPRDRLMPEHFSRAWAMLETLRRER